MTPAEKLTLAEELRRAADELERQAQSQATPRVPPVARAKAFRVPPRPPEGVTSLDREKARRALAEAGVAIGGGGKKR